MTRTMAPPCESCDGTGWALVEVNGVRRATRCACWKTLHPSGIVGVPSEFERATLETFLPREGTAYALAAAKRWLGGTHDLYLSGGVGAGKTCLACAIGNAVVAEGIHDVAFFVVDAFVAGAREVEVHDDDRAAGLVEKARTVELLILDDVGATEKPSDYTLRVLLGLYNHRIARASLRTIWTSNKTLEQLSAWLKDDRLTSRIAGQAELVNLTATDYRPTLGQERVWAH